MENSEQINANDSTDEEQVSEQIIDGSSSKEQMCEQTIDKDLTAELLEYTEEYNKRAPQRVGRLFEKKLKKPVMLSYGESPIYEKYSALYKNLLEAKEEYPNGWGKKFPLIRLHLHLKRSKHAPDSDSDPEDESLIVSKSKKKCHDNSSDRDTWDDKNFEDAAVCGDSDECKLDQKRKANS